MSYLHHVRSMEYAGEHCAYLLTLEPFEGMAEPATFARLAYREMRKAGVSPWPETNINLNIGAEEAAHEHDFQ